MSEEEKAIETLKEVASDNFSTLGDDISPQMAQNILNVISNQRKEIERLDHELVREEQYTNFYEDLCNKQQEIMKELQKDKKVLIKNYDKVLGTFISKEKIRDYFAHDLAFKRRLIRENEEISDYNRGKFDTIEDLLERLEDNKWN